MYDFIAENWGELAIAALAFAKVVVNLIPSDRPTQVWAYFDLLINAIVSDNVRDPNKEA